MEPRMVTCPQCRTKQPLQEQCASCGLNFREYAANQRAMKQEAPDADAQPQGAEEPPEQQQQQPQQLRNITCPNCKLTQPLKDICEGCGLDFRQYASEQRQRRRVQAQQSARAQAAMAMPEKGAPLPPVEALFSRSFEMFKRRFWPVFWVYLLSFAASLLSVMAGVALWYVLQLVMPEWAATAIAVALGGGAVFVLGSWIYASLIVVVADETKDVAGALRAGWPLTWRFMWFFAVAGFVIAGGFVFLLLPGLVLLIWFFASQFILYNEPHGGLSAMLRSREYVRGHFWDVSLRLLLLVLMSWVAGMVPLIGQLIFTPFFMIYLYQMYLELKAVKGDDVPFDDTAKAKRPYVLVAVLGHAIVITLALVGWQWADNEIKPKIEDSSGIFKSVPSIMMTEISTDKEVYAPFEEIVIEFSGLPGNSHDWITLVDKDSPDDTYGQWFYTEGKTEGKHTFSGVTAGKYEVRVYYDWPAGGFDVQERYDFDVK